VRKPVLRHRIFQRARDVGLADQIVKCLGPILSGENLVTHLMNLIVMSSEVETSRCETIGTTTRFDSLTSRSLSLRPSRPCRGSPAAPFWNWLRSIRSDSAVKTKKEAPPVSQRGPLSTCPNYSVIVMQQAPGQHAPPAQQPSSPDEIVVAAVSVIIAAIKSRYFIILSC
jgi:hypothetical protein